MIKNMANNEIPNWLALHEGDYIVDENNIEYKVVYAGLGRFCLQGNGAYNKCYTSDLNDKFIKGEFKFAPSMDVENLKSLIKKDNLTERQIEYIKKALDVYNALDI